MQPSATVSSMKSKKRDTTHTSLNFFFFSREDRTESSKEPEYVPSSSGMQDIAAGFRLLLLMTLQLYLPSATSSPPPVSSCSGLFTWCQPLYANCCAVLLYFSRYCMVNFNCFLYLLYLSFYVLFVWKLLSAYYSRVLYSQLCYLGT